MIESIDDLIIFLKQFHSNVLEEPSLPSEQIPADLPEGLAKIYRNLGGWINLPNSPFNNTHDYLHPVRWLWSEELLPVGAMVKFCSGWLFEIDEQWNWIAYFPFGHIDPPVYLYDDWDRQPPNEKELVLICDSLNHFLTTFCLLATINFIGTRNFAWVNGTDNILEAIEAKEKFQPLWLNGRYKVDLVRKDGDRLRNFYISEDLDILICNNIAVSKTHPLVDIFNPNVDPQIKIHMFGVDLPRRYWTKYSEWKAEWLLDETNASIRQVLIDRLGYEEICDKLGAMAISQWEGYANDSWREYTLLKLDDMQIVYYRRTEIAREPMMLLKMTCPSTSDIQIVRVPPEMTSAEAAITWVNHGIHPDKFTVQT